LVISAPLGFSFAPDARCTAFPLDRYQCRVWVLRFFCCHDEMALQVIDAEQRGDDDGNGGAVDQI
jgi:hypothetical protein